MAIPLLAGALIAAGSSVLTWIVSRVVALLGIGFITVVGVRPLLNLVTNQIQNLLGASAPEWFPLFGWLGVMKLDICVSILLSAVLGKMMLSGLNGAGSIKRISFGGK